jgi:mono/diheme cytochrome c family protein
MSRRLIAFCALVWTAAIAGAAAEPFDAAQRSTGWQVPDDAGKEKNPLAITDATLAAGRRLYRENCARCHGPQAKGNGSDADPVHRHHMDLTNPKYAETNPDGVVFHKIWNGKQKPKMPAFKDKLTREQVWSIVAFVQSLRAKS